MDIFPWQIEEMKNSCFVCGHLIYESKICPKCRTDYSFFIKPEPEDFRNLKRIKEESYKRRKNTKYFLIALFFVAVLAVAFAIAGPSYPYFYVPRILITIIAAINIILSYESKSTRNLVFNSIVLVIFNPIILVHFSQDNWFYVDVMLLTLMGYTAFGNEIPNGFNRITAYSEHYIKSIESK